ncbi:aminopeptidase YpdF [Methanobrevibacter filiformis]|uniref:Aminopeptidase YpdF n=2 Tax=Methanobrevibacter filiformis TaxID=55758 RepID=A0A166DWJ2_9EURY|nr:aminopeptidase YpdF [Methanobrevibacter filiformis]
MDIENINKIINNLHENEFDAMVLAEIENINYISDYHPTSFGIAILKEDSIVFAGAMDLELANKTSLIEVKEFKSLKQITDLFEKENFKKIAIEETLPFNLYSKLKGNYEFHLTNVLDNFRMIKSREELLKIEKATNIAHNSFKQLAIRDKIEKGFSEWEVSYELGYLMRENGAQEESFETIVATGANSSLPHSRVSQKQLEFPTLIDWGCKYQDYCSDSTRTIIKTEKQEEIFNIVFEAYNKSIKAIKPGIKACEIDKIARDIIFEYGYGDKFIHSTGHSLGLNIHEKPTISKKDETILEKDMVITIEPGIYLEGNFGVRIEDSIHIKNKANVLGSLKPII